VIEMASANVEIVRRMMTAWERGDVDGQLALIDPDVELREWPEGPDPGTYRGHAGALRAAASWSEAWEWLENDVDEIIEAGDRVVVCGRTRGKGKGSSVEVAIDTYNVYTLRGGRVIRMEFFTTREPAFRAAGLDASTINSEEPE
jgi:ketosteroid isomerase-like protein